MRYADGGPAFPCEESHGDDYEGMSLRDYFAANVAASELAGIGVKADRESLAGRKEPEESPNGVDAIKFNMEVEAALRYLYADAMIKERLK